MGPPIYIYIYIVTYTQVLKPWLADIVPAGLLTTYEVPLKLRSTVARAPPTGAAASPRRHDWATLAVPAAQDGETKLVGQTLSTYRLGTTGFTVKDPEGDFSIGPGTILYADGGNVPRVCRVDGGADGGRAG